MCSDYLEPLDDDGFDGLDDNDEGYDPGQDDSLDLDDDDRSMFADPDGNSALCAATPSNPRNLPCPTCKRPNLLTPADRALGYQCNGCADATERGIDIDF